MSEEEFARLVDSAQMGNKERCYELWQLMAPVRNHWVSQTYLEHWSKEDLQQQSYVLLIETLQKYDREQGMDFWGYYKMALKVWKYKKSKRRLCESSNVESIERAMQNHSEGSEDELIEVENQMLLQEILEAMEQLADSEREFLIDSVIMGKEAPFLAQKYGGKQSTMRSKKKRMIDKLKQKIQKN